MASFCHRPARARQKPAIAPARRAYVAAPRRRHTIDPELTRAGQLLDLGRYDAAERLLGRYLTTSPDEPLALAWLAIAVAERGRRDEAAEHAARAIQVAPDFPYAWFVVAYIALQRKKLKEAEHACREAIRLDPSHGEAFGLLAQVHASRKKWDLALAAADDGLRAEPDNDTCTNLRALALRNLGRAEEAAQALEGQLARTPEDARTHANHGWTRLQIGDYDTALEHFREALRLDPSSEAARLGVIEALKARHWFYRPVLAYFLWMQRLPARSQFVILIGAWFLYRVVKSLAANETIPGPVAWVLLGGYFLFVATSWFASPIANALLTFHPLGRIALTPRERVESWTITGLLVGGLAMAIAGRMNDSPLFVLGIALALMCLPLQQLFQMRTPKARQLMWGFTAVMAAIGAWWVWTAFSIAELIEGPTPLTPAEEARLESDLGLIRTLGLVYGIAGFWISQVVATAITARTEGE